MTALMKKSIAFLLVFVMLGTLLCACGDKEGAQGSESTADTSSEAAPQATEDIVLAENGEYNYRIIYPRRDKNGEREAAESLASAMATVFGSAPKTATDVMKYEPDALEIYVGLIAYEESARAYEAIAYGDYSISVDGKKIVVAAYESNILQAAVNDLIASMRSASTKERLVLPKDFTANKTVSDMLSSLPKIDEETPKFYCIADSMSYTFVLEDSGSNAFASYRSALADKSFSEYSAQKIADNDFATYKSDACVANISYYPKKDALHVSVDSTKYTTLPEYDQKSFTSVGNTELSLVGVSASGSDENGLSMFMRLADGSFLVWDGGGTNADSDADNLYSKMKVSAEAVGINKVVISGWFLTHCHGDHAATYLSFVSKYANQAEIKKLIISPTTYEYGAAVKDGAQYEANVISQTVFKCKNTDIIIARAGQKYRFADVTVDILYTLDALMPHDFLDYNNSSVVSRVQRGDKVLITTGDAATAVWEHLCDVYGEYLDCDYLQVPHHGAIPGATIEAYNLLKPDFLLWPAGQSVLDRVTSSSYQGYEINLHVLDTMGMRDKMYVAGTLGTVNTLTF